MQLATDAHQTSFCIRLDDYHILTYFAACEDNVCRLLGVSSGNGLTQRSLCYQVLRVLESQGNLVDHLLGIIKIFLLSVKIDMKPYNRLSHDFISMLVHFACFHKVFLGRQKESCI